MYKNNKKTNKIAINAHKITRNDLQAIKLDNIASKIYHTCKGDDKNDKKLYDKRNDNAIIIGWGRALCLRDERLFI